MISHFSNKIKQQAGVTIIDVAIALSLLAFALAGAGAIAAASARVGAEAGRRGQAVGLATQELETLHNYRDRQAKQNLKMTPDYFATSTPCTSPLALVMKYVDASTGWKPAPTPASAPVPYTASELPAQLLSIGFSRIITLCDTGDKDTKTVEVSVYWTEPNGPIVLAGTAYNRRVVERSILSNWSEVAP